jgi:hypothetical protein
LAWEVVRDRAGQGVANSDDATARSEDYGYSVLSVQVVWGWAYNSTLCSVTSILLGRSLAGGDFIDFITILRRLVGHTQVWTGDRQEGFLPLHGRDRPRAPSTPHIGELVARRATALARMSSSSPPTREPSSDDGAAAREPSTETKEERRARCASIERQDRQDKALERGLACQPCLARDDSNAFGLSYPI